MSIFFCLSLFSSFPHFFFLLSLSFFLLSFPLLPFIHSSIPPFLRSWIVSFLPFSCPLSSLIFFFFARTILGISPSKTIQAWLCKCVLDGTLDLIELFFGKLIFSLQLKFSQNFSIHVILNYWYKSSSCNTNSKFSLQTN